MVPQALLSEDLDSHGFLQFSWLPKITKLALGTQVMPVWPIPKFKHVILIYRQHRSQMNTTCILHQSKYLLLENIMSKFDPLLKFSLL